MPPSSSSSSRVRVLRQRPIVDSALPPIVTAGVPDGVDVYDLGVLAVVGGVSDVIAVDVDDEVRGFTVHVGADPGVSVVVDRLAGADGDLFVDDQAAAAPSPQALRLSRGFAGPFLSRHRMTAKSGGGSFVVPATPDVPLSPGTWFLRLRQGAVAVDDEGPGAARVDQAPTDGAVRVAVFVDLRRINNRINDDDDEDRRTRLTLPLALHFTGADGRTAAADDAVVSGAVAAAADVYAGAGVDIEVVGRFDVDGGAARQRPRLTPELCDGGELADLFAALAPVEGAVDVVFVDRLVCDVRGVVVDGFGGLAGDVPGDIFVEGGSGVAVALGVASGADEEADARAAGVALAHELGHFLGLFHTVEAVSGGDPPIFDIVEDTPEDVVAGGNLMSFDPRGAVNLSPGQQAAVRTNPWLVIPP